MALNQNEKLTPKQFVLELLPFAKNTETKTGISALAILSQAAIESGWNSACPGWMYFGVKDTDGVNGNEQLLTTTEYSTRSDLKFPVILSITPTIVNGKKYFKYKVKDYFRKYKNPEESFTDHANFFLSNKRYSNALKVKADPEKFLSAIADAGYATDPAYKDTLLSVLKTIQKYV